MKIKEASRIYASCLFFYKVITWSGILSDSAVYKSGSSPQLHLPPHLSLYMYQALFFLCHQGCTIVVLLRQGFFRVRTCRTSSVRYFSFLPPSKCVLLQGHLCEAQSNYRQRKICRLLPHRECLLLTAAKSSVPVTSFAKGCGKYISYFQINLFVHYLLVMGLVSGYLLQRRNTFYD